jgi:hypothetical protein
MASEDSHFAESALPRLGLSKLPLRVLFPSPNPGLGNNRSRPEQSGPFLLIVRTGRIFTAHTESAMAN